MPRRRIDADERAEAKESRVTARDVLWHQIVEQPDVLHRELHARKQIAATADTPRLRGCEAAAAAWSGAHSDQSPAERDGEPPRPT